jgi:two-component system response regulator AtoC
MFLDEIGEMSPKLQAKLLQVLQDGEFSRLGGDVDVRVDVRVLAATNRNLEDMVRKGGFREDLYYRLNVVNVWVPPLRERKDEIPVLVDYFLGIYGAKYGREASGLSDRLMRGFLDYGWPGNVRELENMVSASSSTGEDAIADGSSGPRPTPALARDPEPAPAGESLSGPISPRDIGRRAA